MTSTGNQWWRNQFARAELRKISESSLRESATATRHKCFLSYHSADASEVLSFAESFEGVFIPKAVGVSDDDPFIESDDTDYVMDLIRDKYLADSTVTIVLVGACTWSRKYVDWEVYSSLRRDPNNRLNGLMAIELPSVAGGQGRLPDRVGVNVSGPNGDQGYARYWAYPYSASTLRNHIQDAHDARLDRHNLIRLGGPRRSRNSACP